MICIDWLITAIILGLIVLWLRALKDDDSDSIDPK